MSNNILFIFNIFPGVGGLETVSNNIIDYIGKDFTIYTLSFNAVNNAPTSPAITEIFQLKTDKKKTSKHSTKLLKKETLPISSIKVSTLI